MSSTEGRRAGVTVALAVVVAAFVVLLGAAPAQAHDYLVSSTPADGSTVTTPPERVTLTFDAAVLKTGNGSEVLSVVGPGGKHFETACPVVANDDVSAAVRLGPAGTYTVSWRIVSADGHPVADSIRFRYAPAAGAIGSAGSASGPSCGDAAVGSRSGSSSSQPTSSAGVVVLIAVVAGVLVLLVAAGVVLTLVLTRRRS
jgi:methionine-rich copper-binding protein CopC